MTRQRTLQAAQQHLLGWLATRPPSTPLEMVAALRRAGYSLPLAWQTLFRAAADNAIVRAGCRPDGENAFSPAN